jgi:hypothetical protein
MGPSFTGKAAQDRDCGDHPSHPGGASSRISPRTEYYAIQRNRTISAKGVFRDGADRARPELTGRQSKHLSAHPGQWPPVCDDARRNSNAAGLSI